jgi:hypothetical protein
MMDRKEHIEEEIAKTLKCLDQVERVEGSSFFYARLQARMEKLYGRPGHWYHSLFRRLSLRPALFVLILTLSIISAVAVFRRDEYQSGDRQANIKAIADEYSLGQNDYDSSLQTIR